MGNRSSDSAEAYLQVFAMRNRAHDASNAKRLVALFDVPIGVEGELATGDTDLEAQRVEVLARLVQLKAERLV